MCKFNTIGIQYEKKDTPDLNKVNLISDNKSASECDSLCLQNPMCTHFILGRQESSTSKDKCQLLYLSSADTSKLVDSNDFDIWISTPKTNPTREPQKCTHKQEFSTS